MADPIFVGMGVAAFNVDQLKKLVMWKLKGKPAKGTKNEGTTDQAME